MKVSFTGFKNAGVQVNPLTGEHGEPMMLSILNCELTNDSFGRDLDMFESVLNPSSSPEKDNAKKRNTFLNFKYLQYLKDSDREEKGDMFVVNDKQYLVNMENLRLFQDLADLFRRISETPNGLFIKEQSYLDGNTCAKSFVLPPVLENEKRLKAIHNPKNIRSISEYFISEMENAVTELLYPNEES